MLPEYLCEIKGRYDCPDTIPDILRVVEPQQAIRDIRALVAEVERLQAARQFVKDTHESTSDDVAEAIGSTGSRDDGDEQTAV